MVASFLLVCGRYVMACYQSLHVATRAGVVMFASRTVLVDFSVFFFFFINLFYEVMVASFPLVCGPYVMACYQSLHVAYIN
jgi:hypothetical protein